MNPFADIAALAAALPGPPIVTPARQPAGTGAPRDPGGSRTAPVLGCHGSGGESG